MPHTTLTGSILYSDTESESLRGSNKLSAKEAFYERKKYKDLPLFSDLPHPLLSWYEAYYFGRVDPIQNGIVLAGSGPGDWSSTYFLQDHKSLAGLSQDRQEAAEQLAVQWALQTGNTLVGGNNPNRLTLLKQIRSAAGNVFVFNFVADAFEDLKKHLQLAAQAHLINGEQSLYSNLEAVAGFENYQTSFYEFNKPWGSRLAGWINSDKKTANRVLDFKSYVDELLEYMGVKTHDMPLTLTGYVVSNYSSPMISALSIELKNNPDYSSDSEKFTKYILDPNFEYFVRAARKYGFYVDRNGPWKLIADPLSPPMMARMIKRYGPAPRCEILGGYLDPPVDFFNTYYQKTYKLDMSDPRVGLKSTLRRMYNTFVESYPREIITTDSTVGCPTGALNRTVTRSPISVQQINDLGDLFWLHTYCKIRSLEADVDNTDYDQKIRMINEIYKNYGTETAMRYINNEIKPYLYNLQLGKKPLTKEEGPVRIGTVKDY
tara:strand:+ start:98 stop:1567 length:1470 start_codon:yes stop_codon:yes gene_type:complete